MLLPQKPHYFTREIKTKSTKPYNPIKHLNVSFWALGRWTHRSFHTPEFSSLPSTAQKKRGRVMGCSSCSWGNFHICEELCSFRVFEMSHHFFSSKSTANQKAWSRRCAPHRTGHTRSGHLLDPAQPEENTSTRWVLRSPALGTGGWGLDFHHDLGPQLRSTSVLLGSSL